MKFLELSWSLLAGDPVQRSWYLEQTFTRQVVFRSAEEPELDSDDDSGTDDRPILVKSEVQDRHLMWITNMINNSNVAGRNLNPNLEKPSFSNYVITMTKKLVCEEEGCMDHVHWMVHLEDIPMGPTLADLGPEGGLLVKINQWVKMIRASHFRNFEGSSLLKVILGRQSKKSN